MLNTLKLLITIEFFGSFLMLGILFVKYFEVLREEISMPKTIRSFGTIALYTSLETLIFILILLVVAMEIMTASIGL